MINSFSKWLENKNLSPAQHKADEIGNEFMELIEKRLMKFALDLGIEMENKGTGTREDVLNAIQKIIGAIPQQNKETPPEQQNSQEMPADSQPMPPDQNSMPQMPNQNNAQNHPLA